MPNYYWKDQVVLVIGASGSVGGTIANGLHDLGAQVAFHCNSGRSKLSHVSQMQRAMVVQADVTNEIQVQEMIQSIIQKFGKITMLVYAAGTNKDQLTMTMTYADWKTVVSGHLDGAFLSVRGVLPTMLSEKFGRILIVGSISAYAAPKGQVNYATAKSGLIGFTKVVAKEMGSKGICCNLLNLGMMEGGLSDSLSEIAKNQYLAHISVKRFGKKEELLSAAKYMLGPDSGFLNGAEIPLSGGMF